MSSTPHDHEHDHDAEPVTDRVHDNSWSANLEKPEHADDRDLVVRQAIEAVEHTADGNHVNLMTHANHGHPSEYLFSTLEDELDGRDAVDGVADHMAELLDWSATRPRTSRSETVTGMNPSGSARSRRTRLPVRR